MYRDKNKYGQDPRVVVQVSEHTQNQVLKAAKPGDKIFVCSWSDFGNNVVLAAEPEHIFIFERHNKELRRREISYFIPLPVKE